MGMNFSQRAVFLDSDEWGEYSGDDKDYEPLHHGDFQHMMGPSSILIHSRSTFNAFNSESLLSDVVPCDGMRAYSTNGGSLDYYAMGSITNKFPAICAYFNDADKRPRITENLSEVVIIKAKVEKEKEFQRKFPDRS